jgi:hypothetical protein
VAIDISGDGQLPQPPNNFDQFSQIFNITLFLTSYERNHNFTISNATGPLPPFTTIMDQERGSTVKHVNWDWPLCLVGDGKPKSSNDDRGNYNISIHQNFRMNGSNFYTIMDLPISVTNSIPQKPSSGQNGNNPMPGPMDGFGGRVTCDLLENPLLSAEELAKSVNNPPVQPFIGGPIVVAGSAGNSPSGNGDGSGEIGGKSAAHRERLPAVLIASQVFWIALAPLFIYEFI